MKLVVSRRVIFGFLLCLSILAGAGYVILKNSFQLQLDREAAIRNRESLETLHQLQLSVRNTESSQRGFLLTDKEIYLRAYMDSRKKAQANLKQVAVLLGSAPEEKDNLAKLQEHISAKLNELDETIQLRQTKGAEAARAVVLTDRGAQEMETIRTLISSMQQREMESLNARRQSYQEHVQKMLRTFGIGVAVQIFVLLILFAVIHRDTSYRTKASMELLRSRLQMGTMLTTIDEGLCQLDRDGKLQYFNPAATRFLGHSMQEVQGKKLNELFMAKLPGNVARKPEEFPLSAVLEKKISLHSAQDWFERKDGSFLMVEFSAAPIVLDQVVTGAVLTFRDITDRHRMEQALRESEERYRSLVEKSSGLMCTHDLKGNLITINWAGAKALGYIPEQLRGRNIRELLASSFRPNFEWYLEAISEWGSHSGIMRVVAKDGSELFWSYSNRLVSPEGAVPYVLGHAHDVTGQVRAEQALKESERRLKQSLENEQSLSRIDFLTQIGNRRAFFEALEIEARRSRRYKRAVTIVYIDLDNFKHVNDTMGHQTGDDLLITVARSLTGTVRETDVAARIGGDEFALLLPETHREAAMVVMEKLKPVLARAMEKHGWPVTFSMGIVTFTTPLASAEEMVEKADALMYEVKRETKDALAYRVFPGPVA